MKRFRLMLLLGTLALAGPASAQFSIKKVIPKEATTKALPDSLPQNTAITNEFFNQSQWEAERRRIRKERNTIGLTGTLQLGQTGFDHWKAGGENTFSGRAAINYTHLYKKSKFNFAYNVDAAYGINHIEGKSFKTEDMFRMNINPSWDLNKNWAYSVLVQFSSQFAKGYKSRTDKTLKSDFMSPGNLTLGVGFTYRNKKVPLTINISPVSGNMTFVRDEILRTTYGLDPDKSVKSTLGSSLILDLNTPIVKDRIKYRSYLDVFTNYDPVTRVRFDNYFDFIILKFLTFNAYCKLLYDHSVDLAKEAGDPFLRKVQLNYGLGLALTFTYKNK